MRGPDSVAHARRAAAALVLGVLVAAHAHAAAAKPDEAECFPGKVGLRLPTTLYAVPGIEMNVYFDNVVLVVNPANHVFDVTCARGAQQAERWTFTPTDKDVGDHAFTLEVRDGANAVVARAKSTVRVAPRNAGEGKPITLLAIGDSLTAASVYTQHLLDLCKTPGNPKLTLIGSYGPRGTPGENRHEGYGGWTAARFATHFTGAARTGNYRQRGSPFLYKQADGKPKLDFARYCAELNGGNGPDFVTILLGCNDTFSATDETLEERIASMLGHYDTLLGMIHGLRKDTQIGALLLVPPAATQDAFGANYRCGQTRWQYKRNQHRVAQRMTALYGRREAQGLFLVPANVNLDCVHNYPQRTAAWNARATAKGTRLANGVHPAADGYRQIGDSIYCWLKARLAAVE
jgi:lysophospholipase L1-like esterase